MIFAFRQSALSIAVLVALFAALLLTMPASAAREKHSASDATVVLEVISEDIDTTNLSLSRIRRLIIEGADLDVKNKFGATPLHMAAQSGLADLVGILIRAHANLNISTDRFGVTPLYLAAQNGHSKVVSLLIDAGANVNLSSSRDGVTPVWIASQEDRPEVVKLLLMAGADVNRTRLSDGGAPLCISSQMGHIKVVKLLLEGVADEVKIAPKRKEPLLSKDVEDGFLGAMSLLSDDDEVISRPGPPKGADDGLSGVLGLLVDGQEEIRKENEEIKRQIEESKRLPESNIKVDARDYREHTALMKASRIGHRDIVVELLDKGADVNARSYVGRTPLMFAVEHGSVDVVKELLARGADPMMVNSKGESALDFARLGDYKRIERLLTATIKADAGNTSR